MNEYRISASAKAQAAYEGDSQLWLAAMQDVPAYLRNNLNIHQIYSIPQVEKDADEGFKETRRKFKISQTTPIHHTIEFFSGKLFHLYRWSVGETREAI